MSSALCESDGEISRWAAVGLDVNKPSLREWYLAIGVDLVDDEDEDGVFVKS